MSPPLSGGAGSPSGLPPLSGGGSSPLSSPPLSPPGLPSGSSGIASAGLSPGFSGDSPPGSPPGAGVCISSSRQPLQLAAQPLNGMTSATTAHKIIFSIFLHFICLPLRASARSFGYAAKPHNIIVRKKIPRIRTDIIIDAYCGGNHKNVY